MECKDKDFEEERAKLSAIELKIFGSYLTKAENCEQLISKSSCEVSIVRELCPISCEAGCAQGK